MSCTCRNCIMFQHWAKVLEVNTPDKKDVFNSMLERIADAETDATHSEMILNGTWPNAKEILVHALNNLPPESE